MVYRESRFGSNVSRRTDVAANFRASFDGDFVIRVRLQVVYVLIEGERALDPGSVDEEVVVRQNPVRSLRRRETHSDSRSSDPVRRERRFRDSLRAMDGNKM